MLLCLGALRTPDLDVGVPGRVSLGLAVEAQVASLEGLVLHLQQEPVVRLPPAPRPDSRGDRDADHRVPGGALGQRGAAQHGRVRVRALKEEQQALRETLRWMWSQEG